MNLKKKVSVKILQFILRSLWNADKNFEFNDDSLIILSFFLFMIFIICYDLIKFF